MTVRDLGYRAYEGELRPASQNTWVMLRYGLWRIWGSWLNRLVVFFFWIPFAVYAVVALLRFFASGPELSAVPEGAPPVAQWWLSPPAEWMRELTGIQFWLFAVPVTLRSGANVIAADLNNKAYQFYFAKPVTPTQYLLGRVAALAVFIFGVVFVPSMLLTFVFMGTGPDDQLVERLGLMLPALLDALVISVTLSILSIGVSAMSRSRALTLTAWIVVLVVPAALGSLVEAIAEVEWAWAISVPGLLWSLGDGLYKVAEDWEQLKWFHSAPLLVALCAGAAYFAYHRVTKAEVIT